MENTSQTETPLKDGSVLWLENGTQIIIGRSPKDAIIDAILIAQVRAGSKKKEMIPIRIADPETSEQLSRASLMLSVNEYGSVIATPLSENNPVTAVTGEIKKESSLEHSQTKIIPSEQKLSSINVKNLRGQTIFSLEPVREPQTGRLGLVIKEPPASS